MSVHLSIHFKPLVVYHAVVEYPSCQFLNSYRSHYRSVSAIHEDNADLPHALLVKAKRTYVDGWKSDEVVE